MSIQDPDGNEIVKLSSLGAASLKLFSLLLVPFLMVMVGWGTWVTARVGEYGERLAVLEHVVGVRRISTLIQKQPDPDNKRLASSDKSATEVP